MSIFCNENQLIYRIVIITQLTPTSSNSSFAIKENLTQDQLVTPSLTDYDEEKIKIIQALFRGKKVRDTTILPKEIRDVWLNCSAVTWMTRENRIDMSFAIATSISNLVANKHLHGTPLYNKKGKDNNPPFTYFIGITPNRKLIFLEINKPKSTFAIKEYKKVSIGAQYLFFLRRESDAREIIGRKIVVLRPKEAGGFDPCVLKALKIHDYLFSKINEKNVPGKVTEPLMTREKIKDGTTKTELTQQYYSSDLDKIAKNISLININGLNVSVPFASRLSLAIQLFETLETLSDLGYVHRDVTPGNVLIKAKASDKLEAYLHDFDLIADQKNVLDLSSDFPFWDLAGQLGLVSHANDIVGGMLTCCYLLYYSSNTHVYLGDSNHTIFKGDLNNLYQTLAFPKLKSELDRLYIGNSANDINEVITFLNHLISLKNYNEEAKDKARELLAKALADKEILKAFWTIFRGEDDWTKVMVTSCFCHITGMDEDEYEDFIVGASCMEASKRLLEGVEKWVLDQLKGFTEKIEKATGKKVVVDEIHDILECFFEESPSIKECFNKDEIYEIREISKKYDSLILIVERMFDGKLHLDIICHTSLFKEFESKDPEKNKLAKMYSENYFGSAKNLKQKLKKIEQEYMKKGS